MAKPKKIFVIVAGNGMFHVSGKRWSDERPDATEHPNRKLAQLSLDAVQRAMPENFSVQSAQVVEEEKVAL